MGRRLLSPLLFLLLLLPALAACGQTGESAQGSPQVQEPAVQEPTLQTTPPPDAPPENPGGLCLSQLAEMTTGEIFDLWGEDVTYLDDWYFGASKYFYYEDGRVPCTFSFIDGALKGYADGSEPIASVSYSPAQGGEAAMAAPGFSVSLTLPQLLELAPEGEAFREAEQGDEVHEGAGGFFTLPLSEHTDLTYLWAEGSDPDTAPADSVTLENH